MLPGKLLMSKLLMSILLKSNLLMSILLKSNLLGSILLLITLVMSIMLTYINLNFFFNVTKYVIVSMQGNGCLKLY